MKDPNHPFEYFYNLIYSKQIQNIKDGFFEVFPEGIGFAVEANEKKGYAITLDMYSGKPIKTYFKDFFPSKIEAEKMKSLKNIDVVLLNEKEKTVPEKIKLMLLILDDLIYLLSTYSDAKEYPFIQTALEEIKETITRKYNLKFLKSTPNNNYSQSSNKIKLKWNGQINVLTTLFHELNNDCFSGNKGEKFLDITPPELIQFIMDNFKDRDGLDLGYYTIQSNINKSTKKAKKGKKIEVIEIIEKSEKNI